MTSTTRAQLSEPRHRVSDRTRPLGTYGLTTSERGASLLIALMVTLLLSALGGALVLMTSTETAISANYRTGQEALYAADAGIERAVQDLLDEPRWDAVLSGSAQSSFSSASLQPTLPDGSVVDLGVETANLQADTDAASVWTDNDPVWRLYAHGALGDLLPANQVDSLNYVAVWVSDDPAESDRNPLRDTNGVLTVRAMAFGPFNSRRVVEATVALTGSAQAERGLTGQRGLGALNQAFRDSSVGTLDGELDRSQMGTGSGGMVEQ